PVTQVVVADDGMPERLEDPREAFADHGRPDVANVHRLGDDGGGGVDGRRLGPVRRPDTQRLDVQRHAAARWQRRVSGSAGAGTGRGARWTCWATAWARARGFLPAALPRAMQRLAW